MVPKASQKVLCYPEPLDRPATGRPATPRPCPCSLRHAAAEDIIPALEEVHMPDFPPFRLDPVNQCLWRRRETAPDERLLLTPKAFAVLRYLVAHAGQLVTQEDLLAAVWPETYVQPEVLKRCIFEIRSALGDRPKTPRFIETLPRRGYRFIAPGPRPSCGGVRGPGVPSTRPS